MNEENKLPELMPLETISVIKYIYKCGTELIVPASFIPSEELAKVIYTKNKDLKEFKGKELNTCAVYECKEGLIGDIIANYKS